MPQFDYNGWVDVDVDDFLSSCTVKDKEDIIEALIEDGYLKDSDRTNSETLMCATEQIFEGELQKLQGKWNLLTREEEDLILSITKRF